MEAKQIKWYNRGKFQILPRLVIIKESDYANGGFAFDWLFLRLWSLDSFSFEVAAVCDCHWGLGLTAIIPRLRIVFAIPCPEKLAAWSQRRLWRKQKNCFNVNYKN